MGVIERILENLKGIEHNQEVLLELSKYGWGRTEESRAGDEIIGFPKIPEKDTTNPLDGQEHVRNERAYQEYESYEKLLGGIEQQTLVLQKRGEATITQLAPGEPRVIWKRGPRKIRKTG